MIGTVRERLLSVVTARLAAIADVGTFAGSVPAVIEPGTKEPQAISAVVDGGKFVLEIITSDDVTRESTVNFEEWTFELAVISYCPKLPPRTPSGVAAGIHGDIYRTLAGVHGVVPAGGGAELPAFQLDGLAEQCSLIEGGAAGIDPDTGHDQGFSAFEVQYRHIVGDPTQ